MAIGMWAPMLRIVRTFSSGSHGKSPEIRFSRACVPEPTETLAEARKKSSEGATARGSKGHGGPDSANRVPRRPVRPKKVVRGPFFPFSPHTERGTGGRNSEIPGPGQPSPVGPGTVRWEIPNSGRAGIGVPEQDLQRPQTRDFGIFRATPRRGPSKVPNASRRRPAVRPNRPVGALGLHPLKVRSAGPRPGGVRPASRPFRRTPSEARGAGTPQFPDPGNPPPWAQGP